MCVNCRNIKNKYTGKQLFVSCGKCEACQEAKALARTCRIRNTYDGRNIALFVTLTYRNEFIPYIRRSELVDQPKFISVYRDHKVRRTRVSSDYDMAFKINPGTVELSKINVEYENTFDPNLFHSLTNGDFDKISVPYYKDLQDFQKRLSIILQRKCPDGMYDLSLIHI